MTKTFSKVFSLALILALVLSALPMPSAQAAGSINLTTLGTAYTENFDSLASSGTSSTTPNGWAFLETGTNANTTYTAGTGSSNTGDTYSFGTPAGNSERAFGGLQSGSLNPTIGASFTNNTGSNITELAITYTGEQWRLGTSGRTDRIDFQISTNATSLNTGIWTDKDSLDFSGPISTGTVGLLNGNLAANHTTISATITGLSIPNGTTFWIRWLSFDATGADDGLAVDDFSLTPASTESAPAVASTVPANGATNVPLNQSVTVTFTEAVNVTPSFYTLACANSGSHTATISGGPVTFTINPDVDFVNGEHCTLTILASQVTDQDNIDPPDNMTFNFTAGFDTLVLVPIHDIQDSSHISPKNGQTLTTTSSIVTALRTAGSTRGFYIQDIAPDANDNTSEGLFVFTGSSSNPATLVSVGDIVQVGGRVSEFRPSANNLTITELVGPLTVTKLSSGNPLPAPVVIGIGGRTPPTTVIEDDATGDVDTSGVFDPASDGIDFYESLEGMLVVLHDAVAVGPTSDFTSNREIPVIGDNGAGASVRTTRGGIIIQPTDFNPERIILNDWIAGGPQLPFVNVGDSFPGDTVGVIDYSFGNYKMQVISLPPFSDNGLQQEVTTPAGVNQLAAATFNVENLAPTDPPSKYATLAELIVNHLQSPDVIAIEEIQDNNGTANDGTVDASVTWGMLISAISTAGGPTYDYRQIDPVNGQDGGAPGGNIRQGFLFRTDRGLSFIDRLGAGSTTANAVVGSGASTQLLYSPGRIDPTNSAFSTSRKPLAGEFMFNGHHLFVIANHFNSKGGDDPLYGHFQPPTRSSEVQRHNQAQVEHDFINAIVTADPNADVVVMGDLNDFEFSDTVTILKGTPNILNDLMDTLPQSERYSYVFEGNSQTLDHTLFSNHLFTMRPFDYDVVHVNSEFANQASDHEPQVSHITLNDPPTASAGGPYSAMEGGSVGVSATGTDLENGPLTYAWDLDNDGSFETPGQSVTFNVGSLDGPGTYPIKVQVTDNGGLTAVASATVDVSNVAPTAIFGTPGTVNEGSSFGISLTSVFDPSAADTTAGFTYAFDCGSGYSSFSSSNTATCNAVDNPGVTVKGEVKDKDGGVTEYSAAVVINNVAPTVNALTVSPEPSTEGSSVTASISFSDAGINDAPFTCTVNYGDGSGNLPGVVSAYTCTGPAHTYSTFGAYTVTISVTDKDNGTGLNTIQHLVIFNWTGFFQPVDNLPTLNVVKAGSAIPVKFSLGGDKGLNIFAAGYPVSQQIACDTGAPLDDIEVTVTAGSSTLSFDPLTNQYNYVWKTDKAWVGTCRQLVAKLVDGTIHYANFKFK